MSIKPSHLLQAEFSVDVLIIGAGAGGLTAAIASAQAGASTLILERAATPMGNTALSAGLIPAAGTLLQKQKHITDSPELFAHDLQTKAQYKNNPTVIEAVANAAGPTIDWLCQEHKLALHCIDNFTYPGHSAKRMHGPASQSGADLHAMLLNAAQAQGVDLLTRATVENLYADAEGRILGVDYLLPDGSLEQVACHTLILACNGFGANADLVKKHIPEMTQAEYCGYELNQGHALLWGQALGAKTADLTGYQGHASVSYSHKALLTWAVIAEGGIQVNHDGKRFSNEMHGYSEQAVNVLQQSTSSAWNIYDQRCEQAALAFYEYQELKNAGAIKEAHSLEELSQRTQIPLEALEATLFHINQSITHNTPDIFGRVFTHAPLKPPFRAAHVTAGLFHTQGGLEIDANAQVVRIDGSLFPNLYAVGGAARGLSGPHASGYLSGNGLLSAVVLGRIAGFNAANITHNSTLYPHKE